MQILLVEPSFPYPNKSKNKANSVHKNFVPLGLLKLGALYKTKGAKVKIIRGKRSKSEIGFKPDKILVTSLFTYWSKYVWQAIAHYRELFPKAEIQLGGIYATLHKGKEAFEKNVKKYKVKVHVGIHEEAEKYLPDYSLLPPVEYHATHMMRGCIRRCAFCGTWKIEPQRIDKTAEKVTNEIRAVGKNKIIFYDNNLLANQNIKEILTTLPTIKVNNHSVTYESQSGFDGRLLERDPELALLIKKAGFQNIRIAWDNSINDKDSLKRQIDLLAQAGYAKKDLSVFMIYNFSIPYEDMVHKIQNCAKWGVQITDCRYRPLDLDYDEYNPHLRNGQPEGSYYIHKASGWSDEKVRSFRSEVRRHNIWIRYARAKGLKYDPNMEKWSAINNTYKFFKLGRAPQMSQIENSTRLQTRIKLLNKAKNYYSREKIAAPDLSSHSISDLDVFLEKKFHRE